MSPTGASALARPTAAGRSDSRATATLPRNIHVAAAALVATRLPRDIHVARPRRRRDFTKGISASPAAALVRPEGSSPRGQRTGAPTGLPQFEQNLAPASSLWPQWSQVGALRPSLMVNLGLGARTLSNAARHPSTNVDAPSKPASRAASSTMARWFRTTAAQSSLAQSAHAPSSWSKPRCSRAVSAGAPCFSRRRPCANPKNMAGTKYGNR